MTSYKIHTLVKPNEPDPNFDHEDQPDPTQPNCRTAVGPTSVSKPALKMGRDQIGLSSTL